ncbi:UDP-glycosyltransferase UGT5-like [Coccinella septempunctata]|uniref:UDP-glycosyltransferase UGT5-like n=1 Tax=Coccinella septempunctata TaxID=41139 RepID=UPI001D06B36F|nr:UDP-glycosyltransferase UGT5-like [Coccinella septempunctata]
MKIVGVLCAFVFIIVTGAECAKILGVFHVAGKSHYMACSTVMKILAERGHDVTIVALFKEKNPPKNYRQIVIDGLYEKASGEIKITLVENFSIYPPMPDAYFAYPTWLCNYIRLFSATTKDLFATKSSVLMTPVSFHSMTTMFLEMFFNHTNFKEFMKSNEKFDAVIVEEFQSEAIKYVAHHFNAPLIVYSSVDANEWTNPFQGNPDTPSYHPCHALTHLTNHMSFMERVENTLFYAYDKIFYHLIAFPAQNRLLHRYYPEAPDLKDIAYNVSLVLFNTDLSVHEPMPKVPSMKDVGGFHIRKPKPLPEDLQKILDNAKHGVIFFSLGSTVKSKDMPKEKRDLILRKFSKLKETVIWKFEDTELPGKPDNVIIRNWLPQNDIFAHKNVKLFISHGGLFSTMEAVYHGLPVMALPIFAEQEVNALRAEMGGFARHLPFQELTETSFSEVLDDLLSNPKYKENAKTRSSIMRDKPMDPADAINYWVEYVVRHKGAPHLRSAALDLEWYEYLLIDVILFILTMVGAFLFTVVYLYKLWPKRRSSIKQKKN